MRHPGVLTLVVEPQIDRTPDAIRSYIYRWADTQRLVLMSGTWQVIRPSDSPDDT